MSTLSAGRPGARRRGRALIATITVACIAAVGVASAAVDGFDPFGTAQVGQVVNGATLLPTNQWVSPLGDRILVNNGRLVSSTLSPDGSRLAALSWNNFTGFLTIINVKTGRIVQQVGTGATGDPTLGDGTVAADGPLYSADGKTLWFPQSADLIRFAVNADGTVSSPVVIPLSGDHGAALPSGMSLSADGSKLYVALNGSNTLGVIDTATNKLIKQIAVGNAPRQVAIVGNTAYVSNEGGRPATTADFTNLSYGTPIVSSPVTGGAITGTVSVVNLSTGAETKEIPVGLQPTALYRKGSALFVANSNDDSMSVIDTSTNAVAQTVHTNPVPGATVGSYANAITMPDSSHVLVSIGRDNAIAVYRYSGVATPLQYLGLLPTDWYPVQVQADPALGGKIVVTNDKGIGARGPASTVNKEPYTSPNPGNATGHNTYDDTGTVTSFALPGDSDLPHYTNIVSTDNAWNHIPAVNSGAYDPVPSVIPATLGGSSPIKHIVVIVKENRTYDQVLGDLGKGNGDPSLTQFGQKITPNSHALATRFGNFDNFYDQGTLSADGHNWIVQAQANDYIEKEFGAFYRSYPAQGGDALAYQRSGFLWNAAQKAGLSVRDFGEYANFFSIPKTGYPTWNQWYKDSQILEGKAGGPLPVPITKYRTYSDIPSLNAIMNPYYPKFDLNVTDQYRVDIWKQEFQQQQKLGKMPNLTMMWLPNDHTSGVGSGNPYPVAQVADNDLGLGRIVDTISHSQFWKSTAIFVVEDDPQDGVDHVDGHRTVMWTIGPYSKPGVHDNYYSQVNLVRTIEQILGIHAMNQQDRTAVPMYSAFTDKPNFAPYNVLTNQIPLTLGAPGYSNTQATGKSARALGTVPRSERAVYAAWVAWSRHQRFSGPKARQDYAKPVLLNRLDWYSAHGWKVAYPGDRKIFFPNQVPGRNIPGALLGVR